MSNVKILPYVYKCTHKITNKFYFGFRKANKVPAQEDLGVFYFTSSKLVFPHFNEYNYEILAEFFNNEDAYIYEQNLIFDNWANPLLLNKTYRINDKNVFYNKGGYTLSESTKQKLRKPKSLPRTKDHTEKIIKNRKKFVPWNKGLPKELNPQYGCKRSTTQKEQSSIRQISKNIKNYTLTTLEDFTIYLQELYKSGMMMKDICNYLNLNMSTVSFHIKLSYKEKQEIKKYNNKFFNNK